MIMLGSQPPRKKTEGLLRLEKYIEEHPGRYIIRKDRYGKFISAEDPDSGMLYIVIDEKDIQGLGFIS